MSKPRAMPKNGCKDCKYARFERTEIGRIRRLVAGRCQYPKPDIEALILFPRAVLEIPKVQYGGIWSDFEGCPVWEAK